MIYMAVTILAGRKQRRIKCWRWKKLIGGEDVTNETSKNVIEINSLFRLLFLCKIVLHFKKTCFSLITFQKLVSKTWLFR